MEPDERRAEIARRRTGIRVEPAFLEQDTLHPNSFDVVFHIDLLSHFIDPVKSLKSMRRLLREDGVICFEVGLFSKLSPFWRKFAGRANMPDHRWFYDERALQATLERSGLEIVEMRKFDIGASTFLTTALLQVLRPSALGKDGGCDLSANGFWDSRPLLLPTSDVASLFGRKVASHWWAQGRVRHGPSDRMTRIKDRSEQVLKAKVRRCVVVVPALPRWITDFNALSTALAAFGWQLEIFTRHPTRYDPAGILAPRTAKPGRRSRRV